MFIEKLTEKDINSLMKMFDISFYENTQFTGTTITKKDNSIKIHSYDNTGSYFWDDIDIYLTIMDFDCYQNYSGVSRDKLIEYYSFMFSNFGEEYLTALKTHLENEKTKELEKVSKKIEEKNNKVIEEIIK